MRNKLIAAIVCIAMAVVCVAGLSACGSSAPKATKDVTDLVIAANPEGTQLEESYMVPEDVTAVAPAIGALTQLSCMLSIDDSKVAAAPVAQISDQFKAVIPSYEAGNPNNYDSQNVEDVIASGAQVAYGPPGLFSDEQLAQLADAGVIFIPMTNLGSVEGICACTELIGAIMGEEEYAKACEFTAYWRANVEDAQARTVGLPDDQRPKVLNMAYSNGAYSCESGETLVGSYIEAAGGVNVAKDYEIASTGGQQGGATLDSEQIVAWAPDYIVTYSTECTEAVLADEALATVPAVANGQVFTVPHGLYLWAVRSGEGALMAPWLGTVINAEQFGDVDMAAMTQDFFKNYYGYDLSADDAAKILEGTY